MGIIIIDGTLPSGVPISNVYASFSDEPVYTSQMGENAWRINSFYNIFNDSSKSNGSNIRVNLATTTSNISDGSPYFFLYEALKIVYPNNVDSI
jgi:hypothetical protein